MAKSRKKEAHKIGQGLKEALAHVQEPQTEFDRISDRVMKATQEFNDSLKEAHHCAEMRVFIGANGKGEDTPMQLQPQIYKLMRSTMVFTVKYAVKPDDGEKPIWQQVKNSAFQDAAGVGLKALKR